MKFLKVSFLEWHLSNFHVILIICLRAAVTWMRVALFFQTKGNRTEFSFWWEIRSKNISIDVKSVKATLLRPKEVFVGDLLILNEVGRIQTLLDAVNAHKRQVHHKMPKKIMKIIFYRWKMKSQKMADTSKLPRRSVFVSLHEDMGMRNLFLKWELNRKPRRNDWRRLYWWIMWN